MNIDSIIFIISLVIGLISGYIYKKHNVKYLIRYNKNNGDLVYEDKKDNCYKYVVEDITCPDSDDVIVNHPFILEK
jgi:hypothetical protein